MAKHSGINLDDLGEPWETEINGKRLQVKQVSAGTANAFFATQKAFDETHDLSALGRFVSAHLDGQLSEAECMALTAAQLNAIFTMIGDDVTRVAQMRDEIAEKNGSRPAVAEGASSPTPLA